MSTTRVLLADDDAAIRDALQDLLDAEGDLSVVCVCIDAQEAIDCAHAYLPDVLVIDMHMPKGGGLRVAQEVRAMLPTARIIAFTAFDDAGARKIMEKAGVDQCVVKGSNVTEILKAIRGHKNA